MEEPVTILKARVVPLLHVPDNNRDRPFTPADVHLLGGLIGDAHAEPPYAAGIIPEWMPEPPEPEFKFFDRKGERLAAPLLPQPGRANSFCRAATWR